MHRTRIDQPARLHRPAGQHLMLLAMSLTAMLAGALVNAHPLRAKPWAGVARVAFRLPRVTPSKIVSAEQVLGSDVRVLSVGQVRRAATRGWISLPRQTHRRQTGDRRKAGTRPQLRLVVRVPHAQGTTKRVLQAPGGTTLVQNQPMSATAALADLSSSQPINLYSANSPFNTPIPSTAAVDPNSPTLVQSLVQAEAARGFVLSVRDWTVPVYFSGVTTPRVSVRLRVAPPSWNGTNGYSVTPGAEIFPPGWSGSHSTLLPMSMQNVPIPDDANPDPSQDAHMTVIDAPTGCEYDLYGANRAADGSWSAVWMNSTRLDGSGVYPAGMAPKASGFAGAAGLIWPQELRAGVINHALFFAYPDTKAGGPVYPATAFDGRSSAPDAIPEGARIQLNPQLVLSSLHLTGYQLTIARALQRYGMYVGDTGGAPSLYAVGGQSSSSNPYAGIFSSHATYPSLDGIPADQFRVLQLRSQTPTPSLGITPSGCGQYGPAG